MKPNWPKAYAVLKKYEGGNVDDPHDNGGRTSRGVTQRVYNAYRTRMGLPEQDVFDASAVEVSEIYKMQYWDAARCNDLPSGVDLVVFDTAVNSGVQRSHKLLQASLKARGHANVRVDSAVGMITVEAAKQDPDHDQLIAEFGRRRQAFYQGLEDWKRYGNGWTKRNKSCVQIAQAWATGSVGPPPAELVPVTKGKVAAKDAGGTAKALDANISRAPVNPSTGAITTAGAGSVSAGVEAVQSQIDTVQSALYPLSGYLEYVQYALMAMVLAGVGLTLYSIYRNHKAKQIEDAEQTTATVPAVSFGNSGP